MIQFECVSSSVRRTLGWLVPEAEQYDYIGIGFVNGKGFLFIW